MSRDVAEVKVRFGEKKICFKVLRDAQEHQRHERIISLKFTKVKCGALHLVANLKEIGAMKNLMQCASRDWRL